MSLFLAAWLLLFPQVTAPSYRASIERWRRNREAGLKADDGWLTVAGLFWLKEGKNAVGTAKTNDIALPEGSAPGQVGEFEFDGVSTTFRAAPGVTVKVNGKAATTFALRPDAPGPPDLLEVNDLTMFVIRRGEHYGIRLKDKNSALRRAFAGLQYFPIDERYRVKARFVAYNPPKMIAVPNILGETEQAPSPGYVEFTLDGHTCRLDPVSEGDGLFFIFKDLTAGTETYPPGRFLNTAMPEQGEVVLDFNQAYNPPCAFTPFATCPLPPKENALPVRIEAGELRHGH